VQSDGRPHAAPVRFTLEGDDVLFNTGADTVKGRNLRRDGRAVVTVDDPSPPYAYVIAEGSVELSEDLELVRRWAIAD
jgi:PPOX class probable F420-dependent enzyme